MNQKLNLELIKENLSTAYIGRNIFLEHTTGSTNDDAKLQGEQGAADGSVFLAEEQTKGRGRMFRSWITEPGTAIAMTVLIRPTVKPEEAPTMTPVLAVSTVEAILALTGISAGIKWPNDIFLNGKKLAGILTEMSVGPLEGQPNRNEMYHAKVKHVVAGIGLNVNQQEMPHEISDIATSLRMETGKELCREALIAAILNRFEHNLREFSEGGLGCFRERLKEHSIVLGRNVVVISGLEMVDGFAEDIDQSGNLVLRLPDGRCKTIIYGDVGLKYKEAMK